MLPDYFPGVHPLIGHFPIALLARHRGELLDASIEAQHAALVFTKVSPERTDHGRLGNAVDRAGGRSSWLPQGPTTAAISTEN